MFTNKPRAVVTVINDLASDARVQKACACLVESGYDVLLIGRMLGASRPLPEWPYRAERMRMVFTRGPFFYFFFNLRLLWKLLWSRCELIYANDLDTLLPAFIVSRIRRVPLIYDSHEIFCEVPELRDAHLKRRIWQTIEKLTVPKLKHCITVNESIARYFGQRYGTKFAVVRNIGEHEAIKPASRNELGLPADKDIILLQGAGINVERGAEELVLAMKHLPARQLVIVGSGDVWDKLTALVTVNSLGDRVMMIRRVPRGKLLQFTTNADLGISIDKDTNLNYRYSLPNKLFDYIHAGVPILASELPEVASIISKYQIGGFINSHDPAHIASRIDDLLARAKRGEFREGLKKAQGELTWEHEKLQLMAVIAGARQDTR